MTHDTYTACDHCGLLLDRLHDLHVTDGPAPPRMLRVCGSCLTFYHTNRTSWEASHLMEDVMGPDACNDCDECNAGIQCRDFPLDHDGQEAAQLHEGTDNTMPDIHKDPETWSDKDYEDHDELVARLRMYGADEDSERAMVTQEPSDYSPSDIGGGYDTDEPDVLCGEYLCPACEGTLNGVIGQDGVCNGCGWRAFDPE